MDRRTLLAGFAFGVSGLAGCVGAPVGTGRSGRDETSDPTVTSPGPETPTATGPAATSLRSDPVAEHGTPPTICSTSIDDDFGIRAIVAPTFAADWDGIDVAERYRFGAPGSGLGADTTVVGLTDGERARAYPLSVVWWHEIVNDAFGSTAGTPDGGPDGTSERPVIVTYCPICQSGMVADRTVDGQPTTFGVSGQLWQPPGLQTEAAKLGERSFGATVRDPDAEARNSGNLVMYDEATRSYWSQILAKAICGPRVGDELTVRPSTVTSWGEWRAEHPTSEVLLPPPYSTVM